MYVPCEHKTYKNYVISKREVEGELKSVWKCSRCGNEDIWGPTWTYYGNLECRHCWLAQMDSVNCGCQSETDYATSDKGEL